MPLGKEMIRIGLSRIFKPEFIEAVTRRPQFCRGYPFVTKTRAARGNYTF
ncbi:MAG: hypothetical protein QXH02_07360 [Desulfurococcaceae archaeon]